jgi:Ca2+-binding RTX toxin-like protein
MDTTLFSNALYDLPKWLDISALYSLYTADFLEKNDNDFILDANNNLSFTTDVGDKLVYKSTWSTALDWYSREELTLTGAGADKTKLYYLGTVGKDWSTGSYETKYSTGAKATDEDYVSFTSKISHTSTTSSASQSFKNGLGQTCDHVRKGKYSEKNGVTTANYTISKLSFTNLELGTKGSLVGSEQLKFDTETGEIVSENSKITSLNLENSDFVLTVKNLVIADKAVFKDFYFDTLLGESTDSWDTLEAAAVNLGATLLESATSVTSVTFKAKGATDVGFEGTSGADVCTGNAGSNTFWGFAGNDTLSGGAGIDLLAGGLGNDKLIGGSGSDLFVFDSELNARSNKDTITDFSMSQSDRIGLKVDVFGLTEITADNIRINKSGKAEDQDDFIVFNTRTKTLSFDADGNGTEHLAIEFVVLTGVSTITENMFVFA